MPQVQGAPKGLNGILESVYSGCMENRAGTKEDKRICSATAWTQAKKQYRQDAKGKWHLISKRI